MRKYLILFVVSCLASMLTAGTRIDSLEVYLNTAEQNEKVAILNELSQAYQEISVRKSIEFAQTALQLAQESEIKEDIAESFATLGSSYYFLSNYKKALEYHSSALELYQQLAIKHGMLMTNNYIGLDHEKLGNYDKALDFFLISLKISNETSDQNGISLGLNNLGNLYHSIKNYDKALDYYQQAFKIEKTAGNQKTISTALNNIGTALMDNGDYTQALEYYNQSLKIEQQLGNVKGISSVLCNLGIIHEKINEYDKAITYFNRSLDLILETGNQYGIAVTFINIGKLQLRMNNLTDAYASINQGLTFATNIGAKQLIMKGYLALSDFYKIKQNNDESLHYFKLYSNLKDEIFNDEMTQKVTNIQKQFEAEEREHDLVSLGNKNQIMKLKAEKRKLHLLLLLTSLFITSGFTIYLFTRYKNKNTNNKLLQREILDRISAEKRLIKRLKIEKVVSKISSRFINVSDFDSAIDETLMNIGKMCGASRSYLFLLDNNKNTIDNTHEWCNDEVQSQISNLQDIPVDSLPWWMAKLENDEVIHIPNVSKMSSEAHKEKIFLQQQNIKSILVLPLRSSDHLIGFMGFDNVSKAEEWKEEELSLLRISTEILGVYFDKRTIDSKLEKAYFGLEKRVHDRTRELAETNHELQVEVTERKRVEIQLNDSFLRLKKAIEETISAFISAVEIRDPYTAGHQLRVAKLSCEIANGMKLSKMQLDAIRIAAILHDIGKIYIPNEILSKPSKLTETEFSVIKNHPLAGYDILKTIDFQMPIAKIVYQHHEKINGSGYPQGLIGNEIMLEARIVNVADVVDAMISHRPYRSSHGIDEALDEIKTNAGILYDPEVVDVCLDLFNEKGFQFEEIKIRTAPR
ncbi:MAG: tetratricopeptide repeat protein [Candidatus Tenebribacter davisii]|nr:tetratricopeptide repeat protein [Candidatus Tenebribacter davisii]